MAMTGSGLIGRRGLVLATGAALLAGGAGRAAAQGTSQGAGPGTAPGTWPERPIRFIVGYPAGGPSDTFARLIGGQMAPRLGQNIVVENRPGGGAVLASETAARAAPDGHTLLHVDNGILVYNPALYARLPYDPDRDLTGVGFIGRFPLFIVVRPDASWRDFAQFVAASRTRAPTYGTPAVASPHHLAMEMVRRRTGLAAEHVPYRGGPAAMQDLLAGNVDSVCIDCATGIPFIRDGRVRALVVLSEARSAQAPEVPTGREQGHADLVAFGWQGVSVPAGTPAPVVARLNAEMQRALGTEEIQRRFRDLGIEGAPWSAAEFQAFVAREAAQWRPLIRDLGIRLDS
jgi:tripartite-type tricarboxylate transporter receptor subunit TctC